MFLFLCLPGNLWMPNTESFTLSHAACFIPLSFVLGGVMARCSVQLLLLWWCSWQWTGALGNWLLPSFGHQCVICQMSNVLETTCHVLRFVSLVISSVRVNWVPITPSLLEVEVTFTLQKDNNSIFFWFWGQKWLLNVRKHYSWRKSMMNLSSLKLSTSFLQETPKEDKKHAIN